MIVLYRGSGASGFELVGQDPGGHSWTAIRDAALKLLSARRQTDAVKYLLEIPFNLSDGTNFFGDEFTVLHVVVPVERYVQLAALEFDKSARSAMAQIAEAISEIGPFVRFVAVELDTRPVPLVSLPKTRITAATVGQALRDAQHLFERSGPVSAVDRVHTAFHGYLRVLCAEADIDTASDAGLTELFRQLRQHHQNFRDGPFAELATRVVKSLASVVDAVNTARNQASVAHPNVTLLGEAEAVLMINSVRTMLHYLDVKTKKTEDPA